MSGIDLDILNMSAPRTAPRDAETEGQNRRLQIMTEVASRSAPTAANPSAEFRMTEVASRFGITTDDLGELASIGANSINRAMFEITRAGIAFLRAQELLSLGNFGSDARFRTSETSGFVQWIESNGLAQQRVYEAMRIAKFVSALPPHQLDDVLSLGKVKVMLLASLPQEVIDRAAESGHDLIETADLKTVAQLKEEIKTLQRREKNFEAELERSGNQIKRLSESKKRTTDFLLRTEELREECMALQLGNELHLNSLRKLFDGTDMQAPEGDLQAEHIWVVANTVASRALDLVEYIRARVPEGMPDRPMTRHMLTPAEAERWLLDYQLIENRFAAEAAVRESRREAARPRGPGRPKASKTATGE